MADGRAVLICTADGALGNALASSLGAAGYSVALAASRQQALRLAADLRLGCIILDLVLPDSSAGEVLAALRAVPLLGDLPAIVLLPAGVPPSDPAVPPGVRAISKPVDPSVLVPAVEEAERSTRGATAPGLRLDLRALSARWGDRVVVLTPTEVRLLAALLERRGQPVSLPELMAACWAVAPTLGGPELVRVHMRNLRAKLADLADVPEGFIRTVPRQGYLVSAELPVAPSGQPVGGF